MDIRELDNQIAATIGTEDELHGGEVIKAEVTHEYSYSLSVPDFVSATDPPVRREAPISLLSKVNCAVA